MCYIRLEYNSTLYFAVCVASRAGKVETTGTKLFDEPIIVCVTCAGSQSSPCCQKFTLEVAVVNVKIELKDVNYVKKINLLRYSNHQTSHLK